MQQLLCLRIVRLKLRTLKKQLDVDASVAWGASAYIAGESICDSNRWLGALNRPGFEPWDPMTTLHVWGGARGVCLGRQSVLAVL